MKRFKRARETILIWLGAALILSVVYLDPSVLFQSHNINAAILSWNGYSIGTTTGRIYSWNGYSISNATGAVYSWNGIIYTDSPAPGNLTVNATQVAFGSVTSGQIGGPVTITWTNSGGMTITPTFALAGTNSNQYTYTSYVNTTLAPSSTGTMKVYFVPTTTTPDPLAGQVNGNW